MSKFFINRPIVAMVIAILMVIAGAVTIASLPIALFPQIAPPEVQVSAVYTGADAQTIEQSVATPIEQQMSGVDNMNYMYSLNATAKGDMRLIVDFDVKTDPNTDLILAQMRQTLAASQLPAEVNAYIDHRLWVAGRKQPSLFTDEARQVIAEYSCGIPRNINNLCFNAMSLGCALGRETINGDIVREAIRDLDLTPLMEKKVAVKISEKEPAREAPVRAYPRKEKSTSTSISSGWARRLAVGAILFLTMSGSAGQVNREEARLREALPDPSAQISPPLAPALAGTADSASALIEPAADSAKSGETLRSNEVEGAVTSRGEIPAEDRGPNGLRSDPSRVQPDGSPGKTTRDATERGSGTRVAGIQNQ